MSVTPTPLPSPGQGNPKRCPARCASLAGLPSTPPGDGVWVYEVARFLQLNLIGSELNLTYCAIESELNLTYFQLNLIGVSKYVNGHLPRPRQRRAWPS